MKLSNYFSQFYEWLAKTFQDYHQDDVHRWLSQSADVVDLEHRMKALDRNGGWL